MRRSFATVIGAGALLATAALAFGQPPPGQPRLDSARYTADGRLEFPADAERWMFVGTGIGSDYNEQPFDPANPPSIAVAQIEPGAYRHYLETGRYADGTMFLLTFYRPLEKPEPALTGFVQGDVVQREIHVIDRQTFPEEGRAFFVFPGTSSDPAPQLPVGSECVRCHTEHGRVDGTFVQFYPPMRQTLDAAR